MINDSRQPVKFSDLEASEETCHESIAYAGTAAFYPFKKTTKRNDKV
jgi:hypothetical protein